MLSAANTSAETGFFELAKLSDDQRSLQPLPGARSLPDAGRSRVAPGVRITPDAARAAGREGALRLGGRRCDERRLERRERKRALRAAADAGAVLRAPPQRTTVGDYVGLCLLVDFADVPASVPRDEADRFCNQVGYSGFGNQGSVHDYFLAQSAGRCRYTNVVAPCYRARRPQSWYTERTVAMGERARELIGEALAHHKAQGLDFAALTADGSGMVYAVNVFYAGPWSTTGAKACGRTPGCWARRCRWRPARRPSTTRSRRWAARRCSAPSATKTATCCATTPTCTTSAVNPAASATSA